MTPPGECIIAAILYCGHYIIEGRENGLSGLFAIYLNLAKLLKLGKCQDLRGSSCTVESMKVQLDLD